VHGVEEVVVVRDAEAWRDGGSVLVFDSVEAAEKHFRFATEGKAPVNVFHYPEDEDSLGHHVIEVRHSPGVVAEYVATSHPVVRREHRR
jgi:hypothetical protein